MLYFIHKMGDKMKNNKKIILFVLVLILIGVVVFLVGKSFGFFQYAREGETVNIITISGIEVEILSEEEDVLNLENAYPMYDEEGKSLTPFIFKVTNTTSRDLIYNIKVVSDPEKLNACTLEDDSKCQELSTDNIKFVYQKDEEDYTSPAVLGDRENIIATETIPAKGSLTHSIILWIKSDAGNEIMNQYFYGQIILEGTATN